MTETVERPGQTDSESGEQARELADRWLAAFGAALEQGDVGVVDRLFLADGWWRDLLTFTWDLRTFHGTEAIQSALAAALDATQPTGFHLAEGKEPSFEEPDEDTRWLQAFFEFDTAIARGRGLFRLLRDGDDWKAWTVLTAMEELKGFEEPVGPQRPKGVDHGEHRDRKNWLDQRRERREFTDADPDVIVVGAGQAGLSIAARLGQLGVDALVVEKNDRIGDNWRKRYHSLVLHDPVWYDHMAYLPFPKHWPVFTPKDKLADWFQTYASAMELNVWTGSEFLGGGYDADAHQWTVTVRRDDGSERTLHPRHVVMATGMSGVPNVPEFEGADEFEGQLGHSSRHPGASEFSRAKNAVVVGSNNSGHDIAHDFYEHGIDVTMVQRSGTYVITSQSITDVIFAGFYEEGGPPVEDADVMFASLPYFLVGQLHQGATQYIADELDTELLEGLKKAGFNVEFGEDGSGLFMLYLQRGGGYYIDVGASQLIADGKIKVKQGEEIERFTKNAVVLTDGTELPADVVVLATGYQNMRESARELLGDEVADRCNVVWGLDDEGEIRTMWRRSGHPGFWFMGGNLHQARHYSKFLAFQIKAIEEGLIER